MFKLEIKTNNAAFTDDSAPDAERDDASARGEQVTLILRAIAKLTEQGYTEGPATDSNGNRCGYWTLTEE